MELDETPFDRCEYLLPSGCKDLIDKIQLAQVKSQRKLRLRPSEKPTVHLPLRITVRDLAIVLATKLPAVVKLLNGMKAFTGPGQKIPFYTAAKLAALYGYQAKKKGF